MGYGSGSMQLSTSGVVKGATPTPGTTTIARTNSSIVESAAAGLALRFGIGRGFANLFCGYKKTLEAGASWTFDLYAGTDVPDLHGQTAPFRILRGMEIAIIDGGDSTGVRIGGASSNEFIGWFVSAGDQQDIYPDGTPYMVGSPAGKTVSSSVKNVKVENRSAVEVVLKVLLAGSTFETGQVAGMWPLIQTYS